jgi:hypothetical protein
MLPLLSRQLLTQWPDLHMGRGRPDRLSFLGVRTGVGDGYAFFLAFADRDPVPCLAVKIPREPAAESRLGHEWNVLNHFEQHGLHWPGASLLRPLLWKVVGGVHMLVTTAPPGQPMRVDIDSPAEHFARVGEWLVQFACATRATWSMAIMRRYLERTVERLDTTFGLSDREMAVVEDWVARLLKMAVDDRASLFAAHGNLRSQNIWLQRDHLTIVNWEQSGLVCLPLQDLFTFVTTYRFPNARRRPNESYMHAFRETCLAGGPYANLVRQTVAGYCRALDIPLESIEACFGIFLAGAALREYDQLLAAADRGYLPLLSDPDRSARRPYRQAIKDQLWINLLRLLIKERDRFKLGTYSDMRGRFRVAPVDTRLSAGRQKALR